MKIHNAIAVALMNEPSIYEIVEDRVWLFRLPQGPTQPSITIHVISRTRGHNLNGGNGYATTRIQIDSWSPDWDQCEELADRIRLLLDGFQGDLYGIQIGSILHDQDNSFYEPPENASNFGLYHIASDFMISYFEPTRLIVGGIAMGGSATVSMAA